MAFIINDPLPQNCTECDYRCGLNTIARTGDYAEGCPIIGEIPDKHGDLIERNALPIIGITDYKLENYTVVEFEDVLNAPVIVKATE